MVYLQVWSYLFITIWTIEKHIFQKETHIGTKRNIQSACWLASKDDFSKVYLLLQWCEYRWYT